MKKLLSGFLVALFAFVAYATVGQVKAQDELIDLYPNNDIAHLQGEYGNSNWKLEFHGRRYHTVSFMAKFISQFNEADTKDVFVGADIKPGNTANAMGGFIYNDMDKEVTLAQGDRTQFTGVINRVWVIFDEDGRLISFEDHVGVYYITPVEGEDYYRLATQEEIDAFDPDSEEEQDILHTHIRMLLDEDGEGYKIEPLAYLSWNNATYVPAGEDDEGNETPELGKRSVLLPEDRDPNHVVLGPGHTALHLSTWDRGQTVIYGDWAMTFPEVMADLDTEERMELVYDEPAPLFLGFEALDDNTLAPGVNIVVQFNGEAQAKLFAGNMQAIYKDEEQSKDGNWTGTGTTHEKMDFNVRIEDLEGNLVDEFDMEWDETDEEYVPTKTELALDTTLFGTSFKAIYTSTSPSEKTTTLEATVDIGVLPININGVRNRTIDQGMYIDLYEGITADDAYGTDISNSIVIDDIPGFNRYSAQIGTYQVTVRASYIFVEELEDDEATLTYGEDTFTFDPNRINTLDQTLGWAARFPVLSYEKASFDAQVGHLTAAGLLYQFNAVLLNAHNEVLAFYKTYDGNQALYFGEGEVKDLNAPGEQATRKAWLDKLEFQDGYRFIFHANAFDTIDDAVNNFFENVPTIEVADLKGAPFVTEVTAQTTYTLTVRDIEAPLIRSLQDTFVVYTDNNYASTEEAVFSNVVATDNAGAPTLSASGLARIYLDEVGEHEITVVATDNAGNSSETTFTLKIVERDLPEDLVNEVDDLTDQLEDANKKNTELEGKISDLEQALADQTAELQEAIDAKSEGTSLVVTIIIAVVTAGLSFGGAVLLLRKP